jgi:hypothetical protein
MATRFSNESTGNQTGSLGASQAESRGCRRSNRSRRLRGGLIAAALTAVLVPQTGCMLVNGMQRAFSRHDALDEFMVSYRNRAWAARAWLCRKDKFASHCYLADLEAGFRQGYEDVAAGGSGCLPTVCPRAYWGWQYQSADGQARMNAWFEGYPLGVQAAEQDGVGHWGNVATGFQHQVPAAVPPVAPGSASPTEEAGTFGTDAAVEELASPIPVPLPAEPAFSPAVPLNAPVPALPSGLPGIEAVSPVTVPEL